MSLRFIYSSNSMKISKTSDKLRPPVCLQGKSVTVIKFSIQSDSKTFIIEHSLCMYFFLNASSHVNLRVTTIIFLKKKEQGSVVSTLHFPAVEKEIVKKLPNCNWTLKVKLPFTASTSVLREYNVFCPQVMVSSQH